MKKNIRFSIALLLISIFMLSAKKVISQPYPPSVPDQHGYNGHPQPTGIPVGNGTGILILLGLSYGLGKYVTAGTPGEKRQWKEIEGS